MTQEHVAEEKKQPDRQRTIIIVLLVLILIAVCGVLAFVLLREEPEPEVEDNAPKLAYAEGTTVIDDEDALQRAVDELAKATKGTIVLEYKAEGFSEDGKTVSCYLANALENEYDMYFNIYSDTSMTEQLYLSGLVRPGNAIEEFELEKELAPGTYNACLVFTQVEEDLATMHAQMAVTFTLTVS